LDPIHQRMMTDTKLVVGYDFDLRDRNFQEVGTTRDHTFRARVQSAPAEFVSGWIGYAHTLRDGDDYVGNAPFIASHTAE
jgi:hypothetical protein